jgi:DNA-directed RNA polymerase specialized sigma24 family protein
MGFVKCVAHRQGVAQIRGAISWRRTFASSGDEEARTSSDDSPENQLRQRQRLARAKKILRVLNVRDREILERFYLHGQPRAQICGEMNLTDTQFRLFKSRAIARCTTLAAAGRPN